MKLYLEDLLLTASARSSLLDIHAYLPENVRFRAAQCHATLGEILARGGFGELTALPLRHEILGLSYLNQGQEVAVGGIVVKNVSGYDFTRLLIGSGKNVFTQAHLRLRPEAKPTLYRSTEALDYAQLKAQGWLYAWQSEQYSYIEGYGIPPKGFKVCSPPQEKPISDQRGDFVLDLKYSDLDNTILAALELSTPTSQ